MSKDAKKMLNATAKLQMPRPACVSAHSDKGRFVCTDLLRSTGILQQQDKGSYWTPSVHNLA